MGKIPSTTMFISGNLTVSEVEKKLTNPVRSKVTIIYTGEKSMQHDRLNELCTEIIDAAKHLHRFLPSVIGLGISASPKLCIPQNTSVNSEDGEQQY